MTAFQPSTDPYDQLYGKKLTADNVAEMRFNLINYVEVLIQMDRQHKAWLAEQDNKKDEPKAENKNLQE